MAKPGVNTRASTCLRTTWLDRPPNSRNRPSMNYRLPTRTLCISLLALLPTGREASASQPDLAASTESWRTVVDGVMGGLSTGMVSSSVSGNLLFTGDLSLKNNGGFSQIRTSVRQGLFEDTDGVEIRVRGDGRSYNFDLRVSNARMMAGAFQQQFPTLDGQWLTIQLPFDEFRLYSFGRRVPNAIELDPSLIESLGVTLSDKIEDGFRLEIGAIRPYVASKTEPSAGGADLAAAGGSTDISGTATMLIEKAINRGAPLFNEGQTAACASIYELTVESLIALGRERLDPNVTQRLEEGLSEAASQRRSTDRAWTLRRAMDDAYDLLARRAGDARTPSRTTTNTYPKQ